MASLKLSDNAFGTLGLTITESIDLAAISSAFSQILGINYLFDSLDLSAVTRTGLTAVGLTVDGLPLAQSTLTVGGFAGFDPQQTAVTNFRTLKLSEATTLAEGSQDGLTFLDFDIQPGTLFSFGSDSSLSFDNQLQTFDFSGIGTGDIALSVSLNAVADFADPQVPFSGYQLIASANDDEVFGFNYFGDFPPPGQSAGSNTYLLGAGNDLFLGGEDVARVDAGDGDDVVELNIELGPGGNEVAGGAGRDLLIGTGAADLLDGGDDDDVIDGFSGDDTLLGGGGNDLLLAGFGSVQLSGGADNDTLIAGEGDSTLVGDAGQDRFVVAELAEVWARMDVADPGLSEAFLLGFTGQVSAGSVVIDDFSAADDLLLFGLSEGNIASPFGNFLLEGFEDEGGATFFEFVDFSQEGSFSYQVADTQGSISWNNAVLQVDQTSNTSLTQFLDTFVFVDSSQELSVDAAFEVRYHQGIESTWDNYDVFSGLSVTRQGEAGPVNGQDKINLALLGLSDHDLQGNATGEVADILFSTIDFQQQEGFSLDTLSEQNPELTDFFRDPLAEFYRPVHVEYLPGSLNDGIHTAMTYVDVDGDGSFNVDQDMVFLLEDIRPSEALVDLEASDLYNPGGGTGIFVFDTAQESFWFNDPVSEDILAG
jgi:hypothetical protein